MENFRSIEVMRGLASSAELLKNEMEVSAASFVAVKQEILEEDVEVKPFPCVDILPFVGDFKEEEEMPSDKEVELPFVDDVIVKEEMEEDEQEEQEEEVNVEPFAAVDVQSHDSESGAGEEDEEDVESLKDALQQDDCSKEVDGVSLSEEVEADEADDGKQSKVENSCKMDLILQQCEVHLTEEGEGHQQEIPSSSKDSKFQGQILLRQNQTKTTRMRKSIYEIAGLCKKKVNDKEIKTSSEETSHESGLSNIGFYFPSELEVRIRSHVGIAPHKCSFCHKAFKKSYNMRVHMRSHTGEAPHMCSVCKEGFKSPGDLKVHMRTHTGENPFKCDICDKSFRQSHNLTVHMRHHTGETPYKCSICNKGFKQSHNLTVHMRSHTGETPFICSICCKGFKTSSVLKVHLRSHTGETPYVCDICNKGFKTSRDLKLHLRNRHKALAM